MSKGQRMTRVTTIEKKNGCKVTTLFFLVSHHIGTSQIKKSSLHRIRVCDFKIRKINREWSAGRCKYGVDILTIEEEFTLSRTSVEIKMIQIIYRVS